MGKHSRPRREPGTENVPTRAEHPSGVGHSLQMILERGTRGFWVWLGQVLLLTALFAGTIMLVREVGDAVARWLSSAAVLTAFAAEGVPPLVVGGTSAVVGAVTAVAAARRLGKRIAAYDAAREPSEQILTPAQNDERQEPSKGSAAA